MDKTKLDMQDDNRIEAPVATAGPMEDSLSDPVHAVHPHRGIGWRLLIQILLFSSLITLTLTLVQLYIDYRREVSTIEQRFELIRQSYLESLSNSLWNLDSTLLMAQLEGIVRLPDMLRATITETDPGDFDKQRFSAGEINRSNGVSRSFPLFYDDQDGQRQIGKLVVHGTYSGVYDRLLEKATVILVNQSIKTFIVSFFILFIIYRLLTRHLVRISDRVSRMEISEQSAPLTLDRKPPAQEDELSQLVKAFNRMHGRLGDALQELRRGNVDLEKRVTERTQSLREQIAERDAARRELHQSEQRLRDIAETASNWFWEMDQQLAFSAISRRFSDICRLPTERLIGFSRQQLIEQGVLEIDEDQARLLTRKMDRHEAFQDLDVRLVGEDGQIYYIQLGGKPVFDEAGGFTGYRGAGRDVTQRRLAEQAVLRANQDLEKRIEERTHELRKLSQAVEQSPVSIIIANLEGNIEYVNPSFCQRTGYRAEEVLGKNPRMFKTGMTRDSVYRELWQCLKQGQDWSGEFLNRNKDGSTIWVQANISPVKGPDGKATHYLAIEEDVSLRKAQEERILHQAQYDSLTDLPNRLLATDRLNQAMKMAARDGRRVAVLFVDLDDFKKVNDTLGHDVGDQLLIEASRRLESTVRDGDTVARQGGDEFLIILNDIHSAGDAEPVVQKILRAFNEPFTFSELDFFVPPSIGLSLYPDDGDSVAVLMKNADSAMYRAKAEGGCGYHFFTPAMDEEVQRRLEIEHHLRHALENDELELVYQPIIDVASRKISGVEVLLRWHCAALGTIGPDQFIPIAENTGIIVTIGEWVAKTACARVAQWNLDREHPLQLSVNVSPRQFRNRNFIDSVKNCLKRDVDPTWFEIEITEGLLLDNQPEIIQLLNELQQLGIGLSMDDFGTGYSSLNYLRNLPFDRLKIDKSFVQSVTTSGGGLALVTAAIMMAHSLGLKVVAEGVETEEQLEVLSELECDFVQGYLFSRPLQASAFESFLVENQTSA